MRAFILQESQYFEVLFIVQKNNEYSLHVSKQKACWMGYYYLKKIYNKIKEKL